MSNTIKNFKVLVGLAPKNHVRLALDEIEGLTEIGYICETVNYGRNNQSVSYFNKLIGVIVNALKIVPVLYRFSPNIIYLNSRFESVASTRDFISICIFKAFYWKRVKVIIKSHGSDLTLILSKNLFNRKLVLPFLSSNVDKWLFLSKEERDDVKQYHPALAEKIEIVSNIIDPARSVSSLDFKKKHSLDNELFKFLFVGRMVNEKGVFTILKSIPLLDFKEKCLFLFVGDGPHLPALKELTSDLSLSEHVRFFGYIKDAECDHFYANADALVFPTFYTEGFPMVLFKSVAAGLPIITTQIRAAKDHLQSPENVLWVDGRSEESTAKAMNEIFKNFVLRENMSKNNRLLGKKFSRQEVCSEMDDIFLGV